ncbi:MAG TPA: DNA alkylation repair protein [Anaerolineales bacterium]|nr:DNA alkylation repair protein [Anaerolineales bacterium]
MPAIDLTRLRKQCSRLADFFYLPDEFLRHLHEMLDFYVDRTMRAQPAIAPSANLPSYHTPAAILKQIEQEIHRPASEHADAALELADRLWDEGYLEMRLLAAFLLGRIPPQEERLLARLTAWTSQTYDPGLRSKLLDNGLARMRKETPDQFLELVGEWLRPERSRLWSNGVQAARSAVSDPSFVNLPPLLKVLEPVMQAAPAKLQNEIEEFVLALYKVSPTETIYFLRQVLTLSNDPMTAITFRRISASFPSDLKEGIRELIRAKPLSAT